MASGTRQLAGTKNEVQEGSRHSARWTQFWPREVMLSLMVRCHNCSVVFLP